MTSENNSHTGEFGNKIKIALIVPTFTQAAYNNAFYKFYEKYANVPAGVNVTTDLKFLSNSDRNAYATITLRLCNAATC
jgi:hypothetical protein